MLVKPVKAAIRFMPKAKKEIPYEGAKEMLLVVNIDNREQLASLFDAIYDELPERRKKRG